MRQILFRHATVPAAVAWSRTGARPARPRGSPGRPAAGRSTPAQSVRVQSIRVQSVRMQGAVRRSPVIDATLPGKSEFAERKKWEVLVSLLSRKQPIDQAAVVREQVVVVRDRVLDAARQAVPMAQQAVPMARSVGTAVRTGAENAAIWATPHVNTARAWAAPRIEASGVAVKERVAPAVADGLASAAHWIDVTPARRRRRWPSVLAAIGMLAAAATAATAGMQRRRPTADGYFAAAADESDVTAPTTMHAAPGAADGSEPGAESDGQSGTI